MNTKKTHMTQIEALSIAIDVLAEAECAMDKDFEDAIKSLTKMRDARLKQRAIQRRKRALRVIRQKEIQ